MKLKYNFLKRGVLVKWLSKDVCPLMTEAENQHLKLVLCSTHTHIPIQRSKINM